MPGAMAPPTYSPLVETASKVVEVPKSTTIAGPPNRCTAASVLTIRSAPTSFGLSVLIGDPGAHARLDDDEGHLAVVPLAHLAQLVQHRGHGGAQGDPGDRLPRTARVRAGP